MYLEIVDIKRNSLDDGPGIRTVIFFKGCPLSCVWCQNPETWFTATSDGKEYNIEELVSIVLRDKTFYNNSGGGVTFSGGEPTLHMELLNKILIRCKEENVQTCLETCGYYNSEKFNQLILPHLDLIYFDLKIFDPDLHKKYCKVPNENIFKNFEELLSNQSVEMLPRIPLIPKVTATKDNLNKLASYLKSLNIKEVGLLPYNPLWISKAETLGVKPEYTRKKWLSNKEKEIIKKIFSDFTFRDF